MIFGLILIIISAGMHLQDIGYFKPDDPEDSGALKGRHRVIAKYLSAFSGVAIIISSFLVD